MADLLAVPGQRIDPRASFRSHGLDSAASSVLVARLSTWLARAVPLTMLWEHPSAAELAAALAGGPPPGPTRSSAAAPTDSPIAIVGLACRFPGEASSPAALWSLLRDGLDVIGPLPARIDGRGLERLDAHTGEATAREGGFLPELAGFDPLFFGVSPREAAMMDPQQRLALELAWELLEDAGIPPSSLVGSATGVFIGAAWNDFALLLARAGLTAIEQHTATGLSHAVIANRISHVLGLEGPSLAVDTACSASLVAVHLACESLRRGESTLALAGGVSLIVAPDSMVQMARFGARSPTGRCRAFDAAGDGYVRAEGAGLVALEPLDRALAAGRTIRGLVLGSAVNNDGRSNGLSAPSPRAQRGVLAAACARAGVEPASIDYVEAHGTGTRLGDPIEASALSAVYGPGRARPLRIGSIKTNIGHTEAAAGVAGLIKTTLALQRGCLPASLHFRSPNPDIDLAALRLAVQDRREPWPNRDGPRRAGVSSFGFGGTNAHVVLAQAPAPARLLALAADSEAALRERARLALVADHPHPVPGDARHRLSAAGSASSVRIALDAFLRGEEAPGLALGTAAGRRPVYVFPGQGGQWLGMGRALLATSPAARAVLLACDREVTAREGWSPLEQLLAPPHASRFHEPDIVQPLLFAVQVAIAAAWREQGLAPRAIVGHSLGEIAAAHVAGALDLADALRVACLRARLTRRIAGAGGVMLVERPAADVAAWISGHPGVVVAARNSPRSTIVSGDRVALESIAAACRDADIYCAIIDAAYASHGPQVDPLLDELVAGLAGVVAMPTHTPMISTVTGAPIDGRALGAAYWARNLREPVEFAAAIDHLAQAGADLFLEIGPHPVLLPAVKQCLAHARLGGHALASMRRDGVAPGELIPAAGALWTLGVPVAALGPIPPLDPTPRLVPVSAHTREALRERIAGLAATLPDSESHDLAAALPDGESHDLAAALPDSESHDLAATLPNSESHDLTAAPPDSESHDLGAAAPVTLDDLCHTAAIGRDHLAHRIAVVADSLPALRARLTGALASAEPTPGERAPRVAFVFPGQGGAWPGMGQDLLAREPAFRRAVHACDAALAPHLGFSIADALTRGATFPDAAHQQPALFVVQVALARTWLAHGVRPVALVGHSMGEVAAAHIAGALDLDDAARLIVVRSRHIASLAGTGTMALVDATPAAIAAAIADHPGRAAIAAQNGPRSFLLAGETAAIESIVAASHSSGAFARLTGLPFPMHCAQTRPISDALARDLAGLTPRRGDLPIYSTLLGRTIDGADMDVDYWRRHALEPVRFHEMTRALLRDGVDVLLELGPHPVLTHACEQSIAELGASAVALGSLRRDAGYAHVLEVLALLYQRGLAVDWPALAPRGGRVVELPTYPFQRRALWPAALGGDLTEPSLTAHAPPVLDALTLALRDDAAPSIAAIERYLQHQAGELLALAPAAVSPGLSLRRLGLDSLMAMRLGNRVREALRVDSPAALFLEDRSLAALARSLAELVTSRRPPIASAGELAAAMEEGCL